MELIDDHSCSTAIESLQFTERSLLINYIKNEYGKDKSLIHVERSCRLVHMKCAIADCSFRIYCKKRRGSCFQLIEDSSNMAHLIVPTKSNNYSSGFCGGMKHVSTKELLAMPVFSTLRALQTVQKRNRKDRLSTDATKTLLAVTGNDGGNTSISTDCIKKANALSKLQLVEHYVSFHYIKPFLELLTANNKNARYEVIRNEKSFQFEKLAFLFPYSVAAMGNCFNAYGIDAAFLDGTEIKGEQRSVLRQYVKLLPVGVAIKFKQCHIIGLSGRTLNNNMILFAICIGYSENKETYDWFFEFLSANGFNMDRYEVTILSDRGKAVLAALKEKYKEAFLKPCPVHIDRNLNSNGFSDQTCHDLYWEATKAPSKCEYDLVVQKMTTTPKGVKLFKYLNKIDNWQLYKAVERGNVLYEFKSDNLIEIVFSWMKEPRAHSTPYFVLYQIIYDNAKLMTELYEKYVNKSKTSDASKIGITQRAYDLFQENDLLVPSLSYKVLTINPLEEAGVVHSCTENKFRIRSYNVNISQRTCACRHWEQSGVPCYHAIKLKKELVQLKRSKSYFTKKDFYEFCYYENLIAMFNGTDSFFSTIPSTDEVEVLLQGDPERFQLLPVIEKHLVSDKSCISSKRFGSSGDKKNNSKVFKSSSKRKCVMCGVVIHKRTKHPYTACMRNLSRVADISNKNSDNKLS